LGKDSRGEEVGSTPGKELQSHLARAEDIGKTGRLGTFCKNSVRNPCLVAVTQMPGRSAELNGPDLMMSPAVVLVLAAGNCITFNPL
jgi:hypothetical protein